MRFTNKLYDTQDGKSFSISTRHYSLSVDVFDKSPSTGSCNFLMSLRTVENSSPIMTCSGSYHPIECTILINKDGFDNKSEEWDISSYFVTNVCISGEYDASLRGWLLSTDKFNDIFDEFVKLYMKMSNLIDGKF